MRATALCRRAEEGVLDQPLGAQGHLPLAPYDHMVMHRDTQQPTCFGNAVGDLYIGAAGFRVSAGVIVDKDQSCRSDIQPALDDLARMNGGFVNGSVMHQMIQQQAVL